VHFRQSCAWRHLPTSSHRGSLPPTIGCLRTVALPPRAVPTPRTGVLRTYLLHTLLTPHTNYVILVSERSAHEALLLFYPAPVSFSWRLSNQCCAEVIVTCCARSYPNVSVYGNGGRGRSWMEPAQRQGSNGLDRSSSLSKVPPRSGEPGPYLRIPYWITPSAFEPSLDLNGTLMLRCRGYSLHVQVFKFAPG
jgi:hypothetical protein